MQIPTAPVTKGDEPPTAGLPLPNQGCGGVRGRHRAWLGSTLAPSVAPLPLSIGVS